MQFWNNVSLQMILQLKYVLFLLTALRLLFDYFCAIQKRKGNTDSLIPSRGKVLDNWWRQMSS